MILKNCKSPERTYEEGGPMGMDRRERGGLSEAEKAYLHRTSTPYAKTGGTLRTGGGRVKLRDRRNAKPERRTRTVAPSSLSLHHWRTCLAGAPHQSVSHTDHSNLLYWKEPRKISRRIAREFQELQEYNFILKHVAGNKNARAD